MIKNFSFVENVINSYKGIAIKPNSSEDHSADAPNQFFTNNTVLSYKLGGNDPYFAAMNRRDKPDPEHLEEAMMFSIGVASPGDRLDSLNMDFVNKVRKILKGVNI